MPEAWITVSGEVIIPPEASPFAAAHLYVSLEDVSRADAAARLIDQQDTADVAHRAGVSSGLPFTLRAPALPPGATYNIRVHLDVDGDGQISRGDLITTQSYPVPDPSGSTHVKVSLHELG